MPTKKEYEAEAKAEKKTWHFGGLFTEFLAKRMMRKVLATVKVPRPRVPKSDLPLRKFQLIGDAMGKAEHPRNWRVNRPYYQIAFNFVLKLALRDKEWHQRLLAFIWAIQNADFGFMQQDELTAKTYFERGFHNPRAPGRNTKREWEKTSRRRTPRT